MAQIQIMWLQNGVKFSNVSQQGQKNMIQCTMLSLNGRIRITSWVGIIPVLVMARTAIYACCMQADQDLNGNIFLLLHAF
jgi:hypothetical protein